jgi:hypothetical protein
MPAQESRAGNGGQIETAGMGGRWWGRETSGYEVACEENSFNAHTTTHIPQACSAVGVGGGGVCHNAACTRLAIHTRTSQHTVLRCKHSRTSRVGASAESVGGERPTLQCGECAQLLTSIKRLSPPPPPRPPLPAIMTHSTRATSSSAPSSSNLCTATSGTRWRSPLRHLAASALPCLLSSRGVGSQCRSTLFYSQIVQKRG